MRSIIKGSARHAANNRQATATNDIFLLINANPVLKAFDDVVLSRNQVRGTIRHQLEEMARTKTTAVSSGRSPAAAKARGPAHPKSMPVLVCSHVAEGDPAPKAPKHRRFRPGTVALREIRKYQKSSGVYAYFVNSYRVR